MGKITIVHLSDIHYDKNEAENQGLVINSFFDDIKEKIDAKDSQSTYCIISGDLVNKGNSEKTFSEFYDKFIKKLTKHIPLQNIYCSPGNHDLDRSIVEKNIKEHCDLEKKSFNETEFNQYLKDGGNLLHNKFKYYEQFCNEKMQMPNFNLNGFSELLIPEISLYFLNCSLFCYGGFDGIDDKGKLKIETSGLNKWIDENKGRTKILVMHHPIEYLTNFAKLELKTMLKKDINIIISGHIHDQDLQHTITSNNNGLIKLGSPQLFSKKQDVNGYSLITFNKGEIDEIEYREWVSRQRKFMSGQNFSGTENGIYSFEKKNITPDDFISLKLKSNFRKSMKSYSQTPNWIERTLTTNPPNSQKKSNTKQLDYIHIINNAINYQIIAAPQFGLTCYAHYLSLKAWEIKQENWMYLNAVNWTYASYHNDMEDYLSDLNINIGDVKCIILDNWKNSSKDSNKIIANIKKKFNDITIIILSNFHDNIIIDGLDSVESHEGFEQIYLSELTRKGLRGLVKNFNSINHIADENRVVDRLDIDLVDLNIHRTPINCIQLLIAFLNDFEDRPINRSKVFDYVLKVIFDNPGNLFYGDSLDKENCGFIVGYFCEKLLRRNTDSFTENEFLTITQIFCDDEFNPTNVSDLLLVLKNNQIVTSLNGELRFRFSYWLYYFAALRMKYSKEFYDFMLIVKHSLYTPEIIEFYTGIDGRSEDIIDLLITKLKVLTEKVHSNIGINEGFDPFKDIKWALNETVTGMTQDQLEENVRNSKLPDEIKDVVADKNYDNTKPFSQTITNFFEEYDVKNLLTLSKSSSRALRNSEFIKSDLKINLLKNVTNAWKEIIRALYMIAPILAKNGIGGVGGARFQLSDEFPDEYNECLKQIIINMPANINHWFKDDIFSDKLRILLRNHRTNEEDPTIKHILALMECSTRSDGWKVSILNYISTLNKNSYYLGNLFLNLNDNYSTNFMGNAEQRDTEYLIKASWVKHYKGGVKPGIDKVSKVPESILPSRNTNELNK